MVSINAERSYPMWGNSVRRIGLGAMLQGASPLLLFLVQYGYVYGLLALVVLLDLELDVLTLGERLEAVGYDTRVVYEYLAALFVKDESVSFFAVEPFYFANHNNSSFREKVVVCRSKIHIIIAIAKDSDHFFAVWALGVSLFRRRAAAGGRVVEFGGKDSVQTMDTKKG